MTGRGRGRLGNNRHRGQNTPRPFEHKLAGGTHRKDDGCALLALGLVGAGLGILTGLGAGAVALVQALL